MFEIVVEALRVVAAFSERRGEGCVWRASKDLKFFSGPADTEREESRLQTAEEPCPQNPNPKSQVHRPRIRRVKSTEPESRSVKSTEPESEE